MNDQEYIDNLTHQIEENLRKQLGLPSGADLPPIYLSRCELAGNVPGEISETTVTITPIEENQNALNIDPPTCE